jgi:hypothetical protein
MKRRKLIAAAVGAVVTTIAAGGVAWAAIGDGGVIQGCYDSGGNVKVVAALPCPKGYTALSWNQKGDPGPKGDAGAKGDPGPAGQPGAAGANGVSPTVTQLTAGDPNCPAGGAAITDAAGSTAYVCGGEKGADGAPFSGTFTSPNGEYSISVTDGGIALAHGTHASITLIGDDITVRSFDTTAVQAGTDLTLRGAASVTVDGQGAVNVQSSGQLSLKGGLVKVGGGSACLPAARLGDLVLVNPMSGSGSIISGVPAVCIG